MKMNTYRYAMPLYSVDGMTILDVGCQDGKDFANPHYARAAALYGVDVDSPAIEAGRAKYPHLHLSVAPAEELPYENGFFDLVISRVALPYTNIPVALREIHRTLKPGGRLFLSMHDFRHQLGWVRKSAESLWFKRVLDHAIYIFPASVLFNLTGICMARPWNNQRETFQTVSRMRKSLEAAGFRDITTERTERHFLFEARS